MSAASDGPADEAVLDYIAGRASEAEAEAMRKAASESPELAADIALMRGAREVFAQEVDGPGALGWARLSRAIDAEGASAVQTGPSRWVGFAATAAASVVVWQFAVVPMLPQVGVPGYAPVSDSPVSGFVLRVVFSQDVTEAQLRALLLEIGATVTGGPSAIGLWDLSFESDAARRAATQTLEASSLVESVQSDG